MAGYRRVNYYELCRLCTSSEGTKMHIFREEGRRRSLPSKIQTCLPLQVLEEDSLPKIICSSCVEKLESYFEFREACINAEAMLESYFTTLKYSDDFTRDGKVSVYVKDESKKKDESLTSTKLKIPVNNVTSVNSVPSVNSVTSINEANAIMPSAIQILTDAEGNRLTQYKVQVQGGIPSFIPYGEQPALPLSVSIPTLTQPVKPQSTSTNNGTGPDDGTLTATESNTIPPPPPLVAAVAITPPNQEILHHIGLATKDRNAIAEVLKLKNINILDPGSCEAIAMSNPQIPGSQIAGQMSNIIPAQIRLDQNQLQHLINSNVQINLSQIQQSQGEDFVQNKEVTVTKNAVSENHLKNDENQQNVQEKDQGEEKVGATTVNGSSEVLEKSSSGGSEENKKSEQSNKVTNTQNLEEAEGNEGHEEHEGHEGPEEHERRERHEDNEGNEGIEGSESNEGSQQNNDENQTYECGTCLKVFRRKEHLFQHRKSHSGERPFVCSTCAKAFSRKEHLLRHNISHTGQKLHACDVCSKTFSRKDNLHKHKKTHGINGPHVCETCGKSFVVKHYYVLHKAQHENSPNTENSTGAPVKHLTCSNSTLNPLPFKCDICTKSFSVKSYLTAHRSRHRSKVKVEQPPPPQEQQQTEPPQQEQQSSSEITIPQPTILTSFPATAGNLNLTTLNTQLTTINPSALFAPNIIHHSNANVVHIGNNSYLCTSNVTSELLEQYRRIHSS